MVVDVSEANGGGMLCCGGTRTELTGGDVHPLHLSFSLICLIRTLIQTEIKPEPLALLAWGFVKPVLLLMADMVLHGTSLDEGFLLLQF